MAKRISLRGRAVIIHSLDHARAAMEAASALEVPVTLLSAPGAAGYAGARWFLSVIARARAEHPEVEAAAVLDCGDEPGRALGALREGCEAVRFTGPAKIAAKIAAIAEQSGAAVYGQRDAAPALDLWREADPAAACRQWLAQGRGGAKPDRAARSERRRG